MILAHNFGEKQKTTSICLSRKNRWYFLFRCNKI